MALDSDSDDNEIILASDVKPTQILPSSSPNDDEDDFLIKHQQITKKLSKSKRKRKHIELEADNSDPDTEILSQQTNYANPLFETHSFSLIPPLKKPRNLSQKRITKQSQSEQRHKASVSKRIRVLNQLLTQCQPVQSNIETDTEIPKNVVSSDTNSSQNTDTFHIQTENENGNENETEIDSLCITNERILKPKPRKKSMDEQHRQFMLEFEQNNTKENIAETVKESVKEKDLRLLQSNKAFTLAFDKEFAKKNSKNNRKRRREAINSAENVGNRRKKQKTPKRNRKDPFCVTYPIGFSLNRRSHHSQSEPKKKPFRRKKYTKSKSNRVSKSRRNISSISSQTPHANDTGSALLGKLTQKRRHKRRNKDPFAITLPVTYTPRTPLMRRRPKTTQRTPPQTSTNTKPQQRDTTPKTDKHTPLSEQLQQLTKSNAMSTQITDSHHQIHTVSKLPHSTVKKRPKNIGVRRESIQEMRTTNRDLQCRTPQRFKRVRDSDGTPQSLKRLHKVQTPLRSDKREMDASDNDNEEICDSGDTPQWLSTLTKQAIKHRQINESSVKVKGSPKGKWQRALKDLRLKMANQNNLVNFGGNIAMPASTDISDKVTFKILRLRRPISFYDLYQTVCGYVTNGESIGYALLYFEAEKVENLQLRAGDFINVYRPWGEMCYAGVDMCGHKLSESEKCEVRVICGISTVRKVFNVRKNVKYCDKYPKYDISVFEALLKCQTRAFVCDNDSDSDEIEECDSASVIKTVQRKGHKSDGNIVLEGLDSDEYWLQNIDAIVDSEKCKMSENCVGIRDIHSDNTRLRGMIQRIYISPQIYAIANANKNGNIKHLLSDKRVQLLVSDSMGFCCVILMDLVSLLRNAFDSDFNDSIADQLINIKHLIKLESLWFEFAELSAYNNGIDYNPEIESVLAQFECANTNNNQTLQSSHISCNGLELNQGKLLRDCKMYYHFESERKYANISELRYFECGSLQKSSQQSSVYQWTKYSESVVIELNDLRLFCDKYWRTLRACTRLTVCVRIVSKSVTLENVIYICDNSVLGNGNIKCVPLFVDNLSIFESVIALHGRSAMSNECLYAKQPLIVLRDIAMYFENNSAANNGNLQLRFDTFSMIDAVTNMEMITDSKQCSFKYHLFGAEKDMFNATQLSQTPWMALQCAMVQIHGNIELVSMKDGFDVHCEQCRKSSLEASDVACMPCLKEKGQIRLVLKRENASFAVIVMSVSNVYYKSTDLQTYSEGIVQVIHWRKNENRNEGYLEQLAALKNNLQSLIGDGSSDKLKQCIIEYESNKNNNNDTDTNSIHNVECYNCFHCVI